MNIVAGRFEGSECKLEETGLYINTTGSILRFEDIAEIKCSSSVSSSAKSLGMWLGSRAVGGLFFGGVGYLAGTFADDAYSPVGMYRVTLADQTELMLRCKRSQAELLASHLNPPRSL